MRQPETSKIKSILVSRTDNLGDVILTLPLISETKRIFKEAKISFLVRSFGKDLLSGYEDIDELIYYDTFEKGKDFRKFLKLHKFDVMINAYPRQELAADAFFTGIKHRVGTAYRWYSFLFNHKVIEHRKDCKNHEAQYNLNLLKAITDNVEDNFKFKFSYQKSEIESLGKKLNFDFKNRFIIIHPGSKGSARDIPLSKLSKFADKFCKSYPDYYIALTGTTQESGLIGMMLNNASKETGGKFINLCGKLNLRELLVLIDQSEIFISNSTGPIHIAGALNKKIIGFYPNEKPVNDSRWGPLSENAVIMNPPVMGGNMDSITISEIMRAADGLINDGNSI